MTLRFQADADLNQIILHAVIRREPMLDFQTAETAGLVGLRDPEVLALAAREGRVLVTHDRKTMPRHFAAFITTETSPVDRPIAVVVGRGCAGRPVPSPAGACLCVGQR
jgi:hypothetical protein